MFEPERGYVLVNRVCISKTSLKHLGFTEFNTIVIFSNISYDPVILLNSVKNESIFDQTLSLLVRDRVEIMNPDQCYKFY